MPGETLASSPVRRAAPTPIVALDVPNGAAALELVAALPEADYFKIGLQLYTAAGPDVVRRIGELGHRIFLDLKFHDIPNTVAGAVRSAAALGVDLLTVHASGGAAMMRAAREAAEAQPHRPRILAVTVLTSLTPAELAEGWGRGALDARVETGRLAALAAGAGADGVVASVHEVSAIRDATPPDFAVLTPGIRLSGDAAGDQARVATPTDAARAGADYIVLGRTVTAAPDPAAAYARAIQALAAPAPASP